MYRSGHNEAVSKTVSQDNWPVGSNPTVSAINKREAFS